MLVDSRSFVILDRLPDLYGLKCDGLTASVVAIVLVLLKIGQLYYRSHVHQHYERYDGQSMANSIKRKGAKKSLIHLDTTRR